MCGADFPLKVSALGEGAALGYINEPVRPPGSIAGASPPAPQPRWPISQQQPQYAPPQQQYAPPQYGPPMQAGAPMSIEASGTAPQSYPPQQYPPQQNLGAPPSDLRAPPDWQRSDRQPAYNPAPSRRSAAPPPEIETEELPPYANPGAAPIGRPQDARPLPPLGPPRNPQDAAAPPIEVKPAATLACPIVSALDRWFANAVQPAARKWFNQPVVEVKQISA
jgi:hypothetical protein